MRKSISVASMFSFFLLLLLIQGCATVQVSSSSITSTTAPQLTRESASSVPSNAPVPPTAPQGTITLPSPTPTRMASGLTVEENPIAKFETAPDRMEYLQLIPRDVLDRHMRDRNWPPDRRAASANGVISRYGFRLQHDPPLSSYTYLLYKGEQLLLDAIDGFGAVSENTRGDDFVLYVRSDKHGDKLLRKDGLRDWKPASGAFAPPVFAGNDLVEANWEDTKNAPDGQVVVRQGDKIIYSIPAQFYVDNPLKSLSSWNGHWVLEVAGTLVMDGVSQNLALGYDEIFEWRLIHGEPFYFFKRGNSIGVSYAGQVLPYRYSDVVHYRCCEPAVFNPGSTEDMIWFHALRDGMWYYVEMGVYE